MFFVVVFPHFVSFIFQLIGFPRTPGDSCQIRRKNCTHQNTSHVSRDFFLIYLLIFSRISFLQHEEEGGAKYYPELTDLTQISSSIKLCRRCFSSFTHQKQKLSRNCTILTEVRFWQRRSGSCQNDCGAAAAAAATLL